MPTKLKRCLQCALFLSGLIVLLFLVSQVIIPRTEANLVGMTDPNANGILDEPEQTIDVLFLGDSECYSAFAPLRLWETHAVTSYNCGTILQRLDQTYEFLEKTFEHQSPRIVILETNSLYGDLEMISTLIHKVTETFPVITYHDNWKNIVARNESAAEAMRAHTQDTKGYYYYPKIDATTAQNHMAQTDESDDVAPQHQSYAEKILRLCTQHGAKLILVSTPSTRNWDMKRHNGVQALADRLQIDYYDLNLMTDLVPIDWSTDTRDKGDHMNYAGAVKVTDWVGDYLCEAEHIAGRADDPCSAAWNEVLVRFRSTQI